MLTLPVTRPGELKKQPLTGCKSLASARITLEVCCSPSVRCPKLSRRILHSFSGLYSSVTHCTGRRKWRPPRLKINRAAVERHAPRWAGLFNCQSFEKYQRVLLEKWKRLRSRTEAQTWLGHRVFPRLVRGACTRQPAKNLLNVCLEWQSNPNLPCTTPTTDSVFASLTSQST